MLEQQQGANKKHHQQHNSTFEAASSPYAFKIQRGNLID